MVRRENGEACVAELDREFAKRTFDEWKALLARLDAPWAPVQSVSELLDDPQVEANGYIGEVVIDGEAGLPPPGRAGAVRRSAPATATGSGARGGHGGPAARAGLRLGRHRRAQGGGGRPLSETARPVPVPDERSREFWAAAAAHVLVLARCSALSQVQSIRQTPSVPHCGSTDAAFEFVPVDGSRTDPLLDA